MLVYTINKHTEEHFGYRETMIKKAGTASIANDAPGERRFDIIRKIIYKPGPMPILSSTG